jgi:energy-coupling factor transport system ATP-binding protein
LLRQWRDAGAALVVVTHDVEFVAELADRVLVLEAGRVVAAGPALEVMTSIPALTPQVAQVFQGCLTVEDAVGVGFTRGARSRVSRLAAATRADESAR